jgi:hypothetical protein
MQRLSLLCLAIVGLAAVGLCPQSHAEDCAKKSVAGAFARAMVVGAPGAWEKVEIKCGDQVIATCTATVPVGGNKDSCRTETKPLTAGEYDCAGTSSDTPKPALQSANCY